MSTVSKISFDGSSFKNQGLSERHRKRPMLSSISQMTDEEIVQASVRNANKEASNSTAARVLRNGPLMFLAATSLAYGALKKGNLSDKVVETAKMLGVTSFMYAASKPVAEAVSSIARGDVDKKDSKPSSTGEFIGSIAALTGLTALAIKGSKSGVNFLQKKFAPTAQIVKDNLKAATEKIDSSKAGKLTSKVGEKTKMFEALHPKMAGAMRTIGFVFPAAAYLGGTITAGNKLMEERDNKAIQNINKLTLCREYAKAALEK